MEHPEVPAPKKTYLLSPYRMAQFRDPKVRGGATCSPLSSAPGQNLRRAPDAETSLAGRSSVEKEEGKNHGIR